MTRIKGWPFLIGKNRELGYRPVVIPDFLVTIGVPGLVDSFRKNRVTNEILCEVARVDEISAVTAIYRVIHMAGNGSVYTDLQYRPILWSAGLLVQGNYPNLDLPKTVLSSIYQYLQEEAKRFYVSGVNASSVNSQPIEIELLGEQLQNTLVSSRSLLSTLRERESDLATQVSDLDQKAKLGKTLTAVGIPLVPVVVGVVVIPIRLQMSKSAEKNRIDLEPELKALRVQIRQVQKAIAQLEREQY